jgi:hypothetical protein
VVQILSEEQLHSTEMRCNDSFYFIFNTMSISASSSTYVPLSSTWRH